jgi:hypothetical protein
MVPPTSNCYLDTNILYFPIPLEEVYRARAGISLYIPESLRGRDELILRTNWGQIDPNGTVAGDFRIVLSITGYNNILNRVVPIGIWELIGTFAGGGTQYEDLYLDTDISANITDDIESIHIIFAREYSAYDTLRAPVGFLLGRTLL